MIKTLLDHDRSRLDERVAETEKSTNSQIILALIQRCDTYTELPWKAFALGASIAGLLLLFLDLSFYDWYPKVMMLIAIVGTLAFGGLFALLTVIFPGLAKVFLSAHRAEVEVQQYAESLFLKRELFATKKRTGILLLVSLFERRVVIIPDSGFDDQFKVNGVKCVIAAMTPFLKRKEISRAFDAGLERLSRILGTTGPDTCENELPDDIIEEKGV